MDLFSRSPKQRVYRLLYLPNDTVFQKGWVDNKVIDDAQVTRLRECLPAEGRSVFQLQSPLGELKITVTIGGSHALVTTLLSGRPILSSVVVSERNAEAGSELAQEFVSSLRRSKPVQDFAPTPDRAFVGIVSATERPFVGSVHWPVVSPEQFATLKDFDVECAAAILWRAQP